MAAVDDTGKVVAIVGGNADRYRSRFCGPRYRCFSSAKEGGRGELRSLITSIKAGGIGEVWILISWIGHKESRRIKDVCKKRGIPVRQCRGLSQLPQ